MTHPAEYRRERAVISSDGRSDEMTNLRLRPVHHSTAGQRLHPPGQVGITAGDDERLVETADRLERGTAVGGIGRGEEGEGTADAH